MRFRGRPAGHIGILNDGVLSATLTTKNTWYPLTGNLRNGMHKGFTLIGNQLTCLKSGCYFFAGNASVRLDGAAELTFGLFRNAEVTNMDGCISTFHVAAAAKSSPQICFKPIPLVKGDVVFIQAQADTDSLALTIPQLNVSFIEII